MAGEPSHPPIDAQSKDGWEVDQDDFGRPVVRHRHPVGTSSAYVTKDAGGGWRAICQGCGEQLPIDAPPPRGL